MPALIVQCVSSSTGKSLVSSADYLQALATGLEPRVRMNRMLVKPVGDTRSQAVLFDRPDMELGGLGTARLEARGSGPAAGDHQLVVLDELTYPVTYGRPDASAVVDTIRSRPARVNVVLGGRDAALELAEAADTESWRRCT